ncbi:putative transcription regulator mTERF family [Medicago truncatula]|uniref:Mitochodrial transcription termination factor-related n=1 Tax=Medicago truncatula TaxID=3880 RepID=A2Q1V4_MEDTR|nr:transcription termination factor MTEF1, chloroplastic [Medicago truncatula]XP_039683919.1 transcription termination factor MTEF1, chloroplastic-like [Medicago truncatula]ABN05921.1 Mitochodrial transcription termination factor-related [Medicago truncatula]AES80505.1 transcription termination factor family protein [Medicago truncatula]RHN38397.1 putative transcription regulator mTERF family [Medicago truncatula]RHN47191.1 putative transcription regulator mTERF family [Medicago truncatula]
MFFLQSFHHRQTPSSYPPSQSSNSIVPNRYPNRNGYIKFRTTYNENLHYLKALTIINPNTKPNNLPHPDTINHILTIITFLKSHSFTEADIPRLVHHSPHLFTTSISPTSLSPVFTFLASDLLASVEDSHGLILRCPNLLFTDVNHILKPTLHFLREEVGVSNLNRPTNRNAHLLNTRVEKMRMRVRFLEEVVGFTYEEARNVCARLPAILGYDVENNLWPKFVYLVKEMEREVEELKKFPQFFGFSLDKRIVPRHLHLKERGVRIPLNRMLMWGDEKFYAKWK